MSAPTFTLIDPRPIAGDARYTFFLPSPAEIAAVEKGDLVKLMFEYNHEIEEWRVERMWVTVKTAGEVSLVGTLDNQPFEKTSSLKLGDLIRFQRHHILSVQWANPETSPPSNEYREYWERCLWTSAFSTASNLSNIYTEKNPTCRSRAINTPTADGASEEKWAWRPTRNWMRGRFNMSQLVQCSIKTIAG